MNLQDRKLYEMIQKGSVLVENFRTDFKDAIKYFKDYLKLDKSNYAVYLYISYAYEYLYKQNSSEGDLKSAKEFADYAKSLAPENKYVKEQVLAL